MISKFLSQQIDFALFNYGLGLIILAIISLMLYQSKRRELPWIWMAGFAIFHGLSQWMDGLVYSFGTNPVFLVFRVLIMTVSQVFLFEFGRACIGEVFGKKIGVWVYIPALAVVAAGGFYGLEGVNTAARYGLGCLGGIGSALALMLSERKYHSRYLSMLGLLIFIYALLDCFTALPAAAGPSVVINQNSFISLTGMPVQMLCAGLGYGLGYTLWEYMQSLKPPMSAKDRKTRQKMEWIFILSAGVILALGWGSAYYAGRQVEASVRRELTGHIQLVEASIDGQTFKKMIGASTDQFLPAYALVQHKLSEFRKSDPKFAGLYLMILRNGKIIFSISSNSPGEHDFRATGSRYLDPPLMLYTIFFDGKSQIIGPYSNEYGTFYSGFAAVRDETPNQIIGLVGLDIPASYVDQAVSSSRLMIIFITLLIFLVLVEFFLFLQNTWENTIRIETSEKRLAEAQTIARIGSWSGRGADNPMTWSQEMFRMLGLSSENGAPTYNEFRKMIYPDDRPSFDRALDQAIQSQGNFETEVRVTRPDNQVVHIYARGTARHSAQYDALLLVGILQDITERKQSELQLRKLSQVIEQSPISIVITSPEGAIEYINPKFSVLTGYSLEEALGKNPRILKTGETNPDEYVKLWNTIRSGGIWYGNFHNRKKNGDLYWESASIFPILTDQGEITNFVAVKEDITERVRAEDELLRAHAELAQTNAELEQASLVKSQFLANMSHEIRTPLNAIIGMTGLLMDTPLDDEQHNFAETVRTSGEVLLVLINDILDFSKIEAQKMELENQSFALRRCIEEALDLTITKASEKRIELAYLIENDLPQFFFGDVTRLRQILVNLLGNAVKFTEQGEVVISVSGQVRDQHRYQLNFSVHDTGIGIPPDRVSRLFQSFSQVDASTTRKYGGTGLGLAISKKLCELMGGSMWVESTGIPGEGSTFHFSIQMMEDQEHKQADLNPAPLQLDGSKILIVDDNKTNREILMRYTQSWKMTPSLASSGQEAIDLLSSGAVFDLAILDLQMPGMDGLSLAREIQNLLRERSFPLILLSSLGYRENKADESRFAAYLTKPIKPSLLFDSISTAVCQKEPVQKRKFSKTGSLFDREMGIHHPLRILLAEDNSVNQTVAQNLLSRLGYRMDVASNGLEALDALRRQSYDLVFMDGQMPEMDGIEATRRIRQEWPVGQQPWIVALTANAMQGDRARYLAAGMDGYISKPIQIEELVRALAECQPLSARCSGGAGICDEAHPGEDAAQRAPGLLPPAGAGMSDAAAGRSDPVIATPLCDEQPAVNLKALEDLQELMGDEGPELVNNLISLYLADGPALVGQMWKAIRAADPGQLRLAAHTFKGNSSQLGMMPLSERCAELEKLAKSGSIAGADGLLERIEVEFERVHASLIMAYPDAESPQVEQQFPASS